MEQYALSYYHFIDVMATHALAIHNLHRAQWTTSENSNKTWIYVKQVEELRSKISILCD